MEEKEEQEREKQQRKAYKKHGETASQKSMTIRIDLRVMRWLKSKPNMGRYINDLIYNDMKKAWKGESLDDEHTWELEGLDNWKP